ncbi:hypothetical protein OJ997_05305 [Solirubrobacter phytolaccae]|uniref:Photosynthesis system II assembly factor Ycf48/Hcf136-like domain-containing protein n=1 Tax=Solirubrobacter phytolaccae TaxID=1404360 RepID=A0A9X3N577_9ACTN|nr:hypothetical protein [Solirubrobacter phytolaccae]MDA0179701.1 hypothetical protein [Solirubrobacter phytolaccae]
MSTPSPFRQARLAVVALLGACIPAAVAAAPASAAIWTEVPTGTTQNITAVEYQSATRFWFTTAAGAIFKRQADGTFSQVKAPSGIPFNDIEFQTAGNIGFAVGNGGQVWRSTDAGATWNPSGGIVASKASSSFADCTGSDLLGDVNAIRFAGASRAWLFAQGSQIATSQPIGGPTQVGGPGTWVDGNRDTKGTPQTADDTCKVRPSYGEGYADAFFATPDVGYIVASSFSEVFFTANDLASDAAKKAGGAGNAGSGGRVIAGDPTNPSRMWSVNAAPYGRSTTAYTRDGWQTSDWFEIGNDAVREFPSSGPADVDYAGGTVLAAGDAGLVLNSTDGVTFFYNDAAGALATQRWNAVGLASATDGAIAGDNGKLAITTAANSLPLPPAAPVPTPITTPGTQTPTKPLDQRPLPTFTLTGAGNGASAKVSGGKVKVVIKGKIKVPAGVSTKTACTGTVQMTIKKGKKLLTARNAKLSKSCSFTKTVSLSKSKVGSAKQLAITVRFQGNAAIKPVTKNLTAKIKR